MAVVPAEIAQDARTALTVALGRVQLARRQADRGQFDRAGLHDTLITTEFHLRRLVAMVDALEDAAEVASAGARPPFRRIA